MFVSLPARLFTSQALSAAFVETTLPFSIIVSPMIPVHSGRVKGKLKKFL